MIDIGQVIYSYFLPLGIWGMLGCIFILFYIDAIVFPTLPELFTVMIFMTIPESWFGLAILGVIAVSEFLGLTTLYLIVKKIKIPHRIEKAVNKYKDFLVMGDERIILLNRIAPILPFLGAFVAICKWSYAKSVAYTFIGGIGKYGVILAASGLFFALLSTGTAQTITLLMILIIIAISFICAYLKSRRLKKKQ
ncbi:MAG: hypothetical protein QHH00_03940 [Methanomassiliicoccales archaeon]|jgi:hypothetical protein|nr:hypothetical protein [Methanomassiliicoccales archaeon]